MPRQARLDAAGTLHHIIIRGIEQRKIVDDRKDRETFVEREANVRGQIFTCDKIVKRMPANRNFEVMRFLFL